MPHSVLLVFLFVWISFRSAGFAIQTQRNQRICNPLAREGYCRAGAGISNPPLNPGGLQIHQNCAAQRRFYAITHLFGWISFRSAGFTIQTQRNQRIYNPLAREGYRRAGAGDFKSPIKPWRIANPPELSRSEAAHRATLFIINYSLLIIHYSLTGATRRM